jgi:hypothetical protein
LRKPTTICFSSGQIEGGNLVHSKKNGEGYVDTDAKVNKIVAGIEEALAA